MKTINKLVALAGMIYNNKTNSKSSRAESYIFLHSLRSLLTWGAVFALLAGIGTSWKATGIWGESEGASISQAPLINWSYNGE